MNEETFKDMKQDVKEIKEGMSTMSKCLERIEVDLRHHIKRSDKHEGWMMKIIIVLAGGAARDRDWETYPL